MKEDSTLTISDRELLVKKMSEDIDSLKITRGNLETQITSLERQKKAEQNIDSAKYQERHNQALKSLANEREVAMKEKDEWHRRNERLRENAAALEKNQKTIGTVKDQIAELNQERVEIYNLRKQNDESVRKAEISQAEIDGFKESQDAMRQDLESQIKFNKDKYKQLMDEIGQVSEREKAVSLREANCKVLEMRFDKKEAVNV